MQKSIRRLPNEHRRALLVWADQLPSSCRLLRECHSDTVLESEDNAIALVASQPFNFVMDEARYHLSS